MRTISKIIGAATFAVIVGASTAAYAATGLVDGTITAEGRSCSWTNATTSDVPPNTLTINRDSVNANLTCSAGTSARLNNSPTVTFNDAAGTATVNTVDVTLTESGVSCRYAASNVTVNRSGTTRTYSGSFTASRVSGFFCPSTASGTASVTFH